MSRPTLRHWCAQAEYPGRQPFLFGTVQAVGELEALRALNSLWATVSPHPAPGFAPLPGILAIMEEEE